MSGTQVLLFGIDDLYDELAPFYANAVHNNLIEITAYGVVNDGSISFFRAYGNHEKIESVSINDISFHAAILSTQKNFFLYRQALLDAGVPANRIIDGRAFKVSGLDFPYLYEQGIARGLIDESRIRDDSRTIYPRLYKNANENFSLELGVKSYIESATVNSAWKSHIEIGKFSSLSSMIRFFLGMNNGHNYRQICSYDALNWDWMIPSSFFQFPDGICSICIGSDVWVGAYSVLKAERYDQPLIIGDGAVIAADSVVVKDVPPYAIVGGNPAQIIKYRFPRDIIEALLRIKWWDWPLEKIHANFSYFLNPTDFVKRFG